MLMKYKWPIYLAQNKTNANAFVEKMLFTSKKQLVTTNANLAMVFICKLFQSSLQVGQLKSYGASTSLVHVKTIAIFIMHVQGCLAKTLLSKICRGKRQ